MEENRNQNNSPEPESEPLLETESIEYASLKSSPEVQSETKEPFRNRRRSNFRRTQQSLANSGHLLEVLRAAMPYIDSRNQNTMEMLVKTTDLIHSTRPLPQQSSELSAASLSTKPMNLEGMLSSVREVGDIRERDLIDKMLNYFKIKKLYQTYMLFNQNKDTLRAASLGNQNPSSFGMNPNIMEAIKSILPPEQATTLDSMSTILNAMNVMNAMGMNTFNNDSYNNNNHTQTTSEQVKQADTMNSYGSDYHHSENPYSSVPNYTYNMSSGSMNDTKPTIDNEYMNQFTPDIQTASTEQQNYTSTGSTVPNTPSYQNNSGSQAPFHMDANSMNQLSNNINMLYNMLNAAGLSNNGTSNYNTNTERNLNQNHRNTTSNMMPMDQMYTPNNMSNYMPNNPMSNGNVANNNNITNNMLNAFTALANSGLLNKNNSAKQNNLRSMPIPNANNFHKTSSTPPITEVTAQPTAKSSTSYPPLHKSQEQSHFNADDIYDRLSSYRNMNHWNRSGGSSMETQQQLDTLEAASLDSQ